jgi:hypothetical protein
MAHPIKYAARNRDLPELESYAGIAATAGTGSDFEHVIVALPDRTFNAGAGMIGDIGSNGMSVRYVTLVFEANITGANTNNCTFNLLQRRNGTVLVNTTSSTTITAGLNVVVAPASMTNIYVGQKLLFSGGTGTAETVTVLAVSSTTFTVTAFANNHSGAYTITSTPIAAITFSSGVNATAWVSVPLAVNKNMLVGGDVLTIARVSAGTGLATPAFYVGIDWVASK